MNKDKILVIEEDKSIVSAIKILLELNNIEVKIVSDREQAAETLLHEHFDLVLCGVYPSTPSISELVNLVKADPRHYKTPFIILAEPTDENDRRSVMNLGADDYIRKPFSGKLMLAAIKSRLEMRDRYSKFQQEEVNKNIFSVLNKNFSQEFITPLNGIVNAAFMLESLAFSVETEGFNDLLNAIYASSFRMLRTTHNILAYSSLNVPYEGKKDRDILIKDLLQTVAGYYEHGMTPDRKKINITADNVGYWEGPADYMRIIFTELIDNAVKFSSDSFAPEAVLHKKDDRFIFSVTNTASNQYNFNTGDIAPFKKFHNDLSRNGLGIGLFISKGLCTKMGYNFSMSKHGQHVTFTVEFK